MDGGPSDVKVTAASASNSGKGRGKKQNYRYMAGLWMITFYPNLFPLSNEGPGSPNI